MNLRAIWAIYTFEMARTARTVVQSIVAPVLTTSLFVVVFGAAIGGRKRLVLVYLSERARLEAPAPLRRSLTIEATSLRPEEVADRVVEAAKAA